MCDISRGLVARRLLTRGLSDAAREIAFLTDLIWTGRPDAVDPTSA